MNTPVPGTAHASIMVDNHHGAYGMVSHLVEAGYRSIALIGGPLGNHDAIERERGYREALADLLPLAKAQVIAGEFTEESGYRAGQELLGMRERPDAVFASNDMMAIGCLFALTEAGINVPRDIGLAGFDDIPIARYVTPPLTTVRVRIAELGQMALEGVLASLAAGDDRQPSHQTLRAELVIRSSSARLGAAASSRRN
jgi:LacI family transcriptional regulator